MAQPAHRRNYYDYTDDDDEDDEWRLTEYEQQRQPFPVQDTLVCKVTWNAIADDFKCPVCLNLIEKCMITECMHRFCAECIGKALRLSNKECPTCRNFCATRRSLRADKNFDGLIDAFCPDRELFEAREEKLIQQAIKSNIHRDLFIDSAEMIAKSKRGRKSHAVEIDDDESEELYQRRSPVNTAVTKQPRQRASSKRVKEEFQDDTITEPLETLVEFICLPHPTENAAAGLDRKYITTSGACKACHISKYIGCFMNPDSESSSRRSSKDDEAFDLFMLVGQDRYQLIDRGMELRDVCSSVQSHDVGSQSSLPVIYFKRHTTTA